MDAENYRVGAIYADLDADRRPLGFYRGGVHRPEQIPDTVVEITRDVHRALIESDDPALAVDGTSVEPAPQRQLPLARVKEKAHARADRDANAHMMGIARGGIAGLLAGIVDGTVTVTDDVSAMGAALDAAHDAIDAARDRAEVAALFPIDFGGA